ncbi:MAG TPA: divalent-cation tolerance protein CutA [Nitrospirae bacterium]|nr:divalent-cation tolerance protein CutA [Nitrospirota bacterium]
MNSNIIVFITAPNEAEAEKIAKTLVEERLAACVNITKDIRSIYRWQGKIEDDREIFMIVKTRKDLFEALSTRVKEIHSYDVPEIIALPIVEGSKEYMQWIKDSTT